MIHASLPTVVVPVFNGGAMLDACLASLEGNLPVGAKVLIADDASSDPRTEALARGWCQRSKLDANHVRRGQRLGLVANCNAAIAAIGDDDILLLMPDALVTPGWLHRLARCAFEHPRAASIVPWSNNADLYSFPRMGESNPTPEFPEALAEAAASIAWPECPEVPAAIGACVYLRGTALKQIGAFDADTFTGVRATEDFSRRAVAMGWRNLLCPAAFVACHGSERGAEPGFEELPKLVARWPDYQEQMAMFILSDPLRPLRELLQARIEQIARSGPQRDLFN